MNLKTINRLNKVYSIILIILAFVFFLGYILNYKVHTPSPVLFAIFSWVKGTFTYNVINQTIQMYFVSFFDVYILIAVGLILNAIIILVKKSYIKNKKLNFVIKNIGVLILIIGIINFIVIYPNITVIYNYLGTNYNNPDSKVFQLTAGFYIWIVLIVLQFVINIFEFIAMPNSEKN